MSGLSDAVWTDLPDGTRVMSWTPEPLTLPNGTEITFERCWMTWNRHPLEDS